MRYFTISFLILVISFISCTQNNTVIQTIDNQEVASFDLDNFIIKQMDSLKVEGLSIAIIRDNKIVYTKGFGYKNSHTKEKVTNETVFEGASISKPIFAYFVLKQVEKGLLELDRPLYEYLTLKEIENDEHHKLITARMILCHTSGLPNWRSQESDNKLKILFEPNSKYSYSGEGYQYLKDVLCHILEVDDIGLNTIFKKEIAKPLNAMHMDFVWTNDIQKNKAFGHRDGNPTDNEFQEAENTGAFGAAYSLHVNSADYAKFLIELMVKSQNEKSIENQILGQQFNIPNEKGELHRSLAFPVKKANSTLRYYHSGNNGDFRAYCHFYKDKGFGIVMLSNSDNFLRSKCAQYIIEFLGDRWFYV